MRTSTISTILVLAGLLLLTGVPARADMELTWARIRLDDSDPTAPAVGLFHTKGVVNDNDTGGDFLTQILANTVTVEVVDNGSFAKSLTLTGCKETLRGARCSDPAKSLFVAVTRFKNFPFLHRLEVRVKHIDVSETGTGPLVGPITQTVVHGATTRVDDIDDCELTNNQLYLTCTGP